LEATVTILVRPLHPLFAGEVSGVELRSPVDRNVFLEIEAALDRYAVLVFRGQRLADEEQIAFSRLFGSLETSIGTIRRNRKHRLRSELADISNLDGENNIRAPGDTWRMMQFANQLWHTDSSFKRVPGKISLLSAREVPPAGGETEFTDLRAAYEALDEPTRERIDGLVAEHSIFRSRSLVGYSDFSAEERAALPPVPQALVRVHPGSRRKTLYLGSHASHIVGWPLEQGRKVLEELIAFATQSQFVHSHRWQVGDLVAWDNRCTLHRARPYDDARYRRDFRRITVEDFAPTLEQAPIRVAATPSRRMP
jgi:alpha-ketoglutarate-dependent 2,4-dichlorophenoxyacetate dioxygenase